MRTPRAHGWVEADEEERAIFIAHAPCVRAGASRARTLRLREFKKFWLLNKDAQKRTRLGPQVIRRVLACLRFTRDAPL